MIKNIRQTLLSGVLIAAAAQAAQVATINFPFRTPTAELPAGRYQVETKNMGTGKYVELENLDNGKRILFHPSSPVNNVNGNEKPRLVFACASSGCSLQRIWESGSDGFDVMKRKTTPAEAERTAVVNLETKSAE